MNINTPYEQSSHTITARDPVQPSLPLEMESGTLLSDEAPIKSKILIFPLLNSVYSSDDIDQIPANADRPKGKLIEFRLPQE
jgi:hypothetical protein